MDPSANLEELLTLAETIVDSDHDPQPDQSPDSHDMQRMAELVLALNDWIEKGGFLPRQWKQAQP